MNKSKAEFPGLFEFDVSLSGNSNAGHEYAAGRTPVIEVDPKGDAVPGAKPERLPPMSDDDRWALVEYLKTL